MGGPSGRAPRLLLALAAPLGSGVEPWSDRALPVRDGLVLWLDASRLGAANAAAGRAPPAADREIGIWHDGSGHRRDLVQRERAAQPRFVPAGSGGFVRFDGIDDVLAAAGLHAELLEFTLVARASVRTNQGGFRALFAANATGRNDYQSGFTVDLGWPATARLESLNVEGSAFQGAHDLLDASFDLGGFHTFVVTCPRGGSGGAAGAGERGGTVALFVDGSAQGTRPRDATPIAFDECSAGARFYSNTSDVPCSTGFLDGEIAELLLFERALGAEERGRVERYLEAKHSPWENELSRTERLRRVALAPERPPPVRFLVPGFSAQPLPVGLPNVNNLRYREDGKLVALAYDGDVWLISDRDGDGLEETAHRFFENRGRIAAPIGMALVPPGSPLGRGCFVACSGRLLLLADQDGDDVAERVTVVADGWPAGAIPHNVDALGVALAPDGRLYFGLGAADYTNPYLRGADGRARYDLSRERGVILEVAPDFSSRRIHCTGIRFPVGLAFNRAGDLFATDQEGATWLANGNPFDELLHLEAGRHYGFPPRHPVHLPGVIDEPSLFDYGPQHQSTCGLCFNEPEPGRPAFGPASFAGDLFVAGYSRGNLFRTELARGAAGYVARTQLLARLDMLACDVALSPRGELRVASHGGLPDWGSGPAGRGRIDRLQWEDRLEPQPLFAWAAGPQEIRVAFDRPLEAAGLAGWRERARVHFGEAVAPGDRFELHRPGYAVVERQLAAPRYRLEVRSLRLIDERRTLSLRTEPHALDLPHALELPGLDLGFDLRGVEAEWRDRDGAPGWSGWLPHPDLDVARAFTRGSLDHDRLWASAERPGTLTLRGGLDLAHMLQPRLQPGGRIDHERPGEEVALEFTSGAAFELRIEGARLETIESSPRERRVRATFALRSGADRLPLPAFDVTLATGAGAPGLSVSFHTGDDRRPRPLELRRLLLPWAARLALAEGPATDPSLPPARPELAGGSWQRGRALFFGDDAMCSRCHALRDGTLRPAAGRIGPDLSFTWQRDLASVRQDVLQPSAALQPDHLAWALRLADGRELAGVVRGEADGTLVVGEAGGRETRVRAGAIVAREPLAISIMPSGLHNVLSARQLTDLFTYLLAPPFEPARLAISGSPPPRTRAEVEALLSEPPRAGGAEAADGAAPRPLRVVLAAGPKDHGPDEHDYPDWRARWSRLLALADGVTIATAEGWPDPGQLAAADVVIAYSANPDWSAGRAVELDSFLARGGGLVLIHYAVNGRDAAPELAARIGLAWRGGASRFRHGEVELIPTSLGVAHPILRGLAGAPLRFVDETYWALEGDEASIDVLATSMEEGAARPQLWTREVGAGRIFVSLPGHYRWTFDDPLFRAILLRAIAWCAREPEGRLLDLAAIGARVEAG